MNTPLLEERVSGALWGALVGDALGVPVEFMSRERIRQNPVTGMRGYGTHNQPPGTWSDDSSMLLCTAESLAVRRDLDLSDLGERFVRWCTDAYWTPHGRVFDIGIATSQALSRIGAGELAATAGGIDEYNNGNGSLMRILPIAIFGATMPQETLVAHAHAASSVTHRHPRSQMACAFYCLLVQELLGGTEPRGALAATVDRFRDLHQSPPFASELKHFERIISGELAEAAPETIRSSGYVIHSLEASIWCLLKSSSFSEAVLKAVNLGEDTDTVGCITGGLVGARFGMSGIPADWKAALARYDEVAAMLGEFIRALPQQDSVRSR